MRNYFSSTKNSDVLFHSDGSSLIQIAVGFPVFVASIVGILLVIFESDASFVLCLVMIFVFLFFSLFGVSIAFHREEIIVDRSKSLIIVQSAYGPYKLKPTVIHSENTQVRMGRRKVYNGKYPKIIYTVELTSDPSTKIVSGQDYSRVRGAAEQLALFLNLDFVDSTAKDEVIRPAGTIGKSLREQHRKKDKNKNREKKKYEIPEDLKLFTQTTREGIRIDLPTYSALAVVLFPAWLVFASFLVAFFYRPAAIVATELRFSVVQILLVPVGLATIFILHLFLSKLRGFSLLITSNTIEIHRHGFFRTKIIILDDDEIEAVVLSEMRCLRFESASGVHEVHGPASNETMEQLAAYLQNVLTS